MSIPNNYLRCIHRTGQAKPNPKCPMCSGAGVLRIGPHTTRCLTCFPPVPVAAPQTPVAVPMEQKPGIHGSGLVLRINGQIRGGKNNMIVTRDGKHVANKDWARWRDSAVLAVQLQLPPDWRPITEAAPIMLDYVASSHQRRDQPAILDSIFHVLEKAGVVKDDTLLWATRSTRTYDKEAPKAVITFL